MPCEKETIEKIAETIRTYREKEDGYKTQNVRFAVQLHDMAIALQGVGFSREETIELLKATIQNNRR